MDYKQTILHSTILSRSRVRSRNKSYASNNLDIKIIGRLTKPTVKVAYNYLRGNVSSINVTELDEFSSKTKHIDINYYVIKHMKEKGTIELCYCPSK